MRVLNITALYILLWSIPAIACTDEKGLVDSKSATFILLIELVIIFSAAMLLWLGKAIFLPRLTEKHRNLSRYFFWLLALVLSFFLGIFGSFGIPRYEKVYEDFGLIPQYWVAILISSRHWLWILFGVVLACLLAFIRSPRYSGILLTLCVFTFMIFVWVIWMLNLPVNSLC